MAAPTAKSVIAAGRKRGPGTYTATQTNAAQVAKATGGYSQREPTMMEKAEMSDKYQVSKGILHSSDYWDSEVGKHLKTR